MKKLSHKTLYYFSFSVMFLCGAAYHVCKEWYPNGGDQHSAVWLWDNSDHQLKCDQMPEFPGGVHGISAFLKAHIIYPQQALEQGIQGRVFVKFRVDANGAVNDITLLEKVNPQLDSEALRVIRLMPEWKPGMLKNKAVPVYLMQGVVFKLPPRHESV